MVTDKTVCILNLNLAWNPAILICGVYCCCVVDFVCLVGFVCVSVCGLLLFCLFFFYLITGSIYRDGAILTPG